MREEILRILEDNDRVDAATIATMLGVPENEVRATIAELESSKAIVKYHALVNWEKVNNDLVQALIDVKVSPQRDVGFDQIAERIYRFPEVKSVYLMSGAYDLSVAVQGKSLKDVASFVATKLATLDHVLSTATHFILRKYKEEGVILEDKAELKRLVVSP
jgi:DNA-binding Lrp family transcriptional regulator